MFTYPEIDPVALALGPLKIHWYGLMYLLAFASFWALATYRVPRMVTPLANKDQVGDFLFYGAVGTVLGGRIGYILFYNFDAFAANPLILLKVWEGGMSFHGGLMGVLIAVWLYGRHVNRRFFELLDFVAPLMPPGLFFGRMGNFINNELWGGPAPEGFLLGVVHEGVLKHPSMLYEAALEGVLLFVLLFWFSAKPRPTMVLSGLFLLGYGLARFSVEFVRLPDEHIGYLAWDWLTMGHLLTVPMLAMGLLWLFMGYKRNEFVQQAVDQPTDKSGGKGRVKKKSSKSKKSSGQSK